MMTVLMISHYSVSDRIRQPLRRGAALLAFLLILTSLAAPTADAQQQDVAFVHGLFGDESSWAGTRTVFEQEFDIRSTNVAYDSKRSIDAAASDYARVVPNGSVFVGHSMGGLISRSVYRQAGSAKVDALVTLGTPHTGAPLATNTGQIDDLADDWIDALAAGPSYQYGSIVGGTLAAIASEFLEGALAIFESFVTGAYDSITDLQPGSAFFQNLGDTRPPVTYAVWSREEPNALWRLADANLSSSGVETGQGIQIKEDATAWYAMMYATAQSNADEYLRKYNDTSWWNLAGLAYYWNRYSKWATIAAGYYDGLEVLTTRIDREWERDIVGVQPSDPSGSGYVREVSDGVVPFSSQAPSFIGPEYRLSARGVNHLEQTSNAETRDRLRYALRQVGVQAR
jgi:pimeloyl-ACP methyl ester carboxylesterase